MGLQEARSAKGSSSACQVLRLCSGAHGGNGGIELWINLQQPIGYSREHNTPIFLKNGDVTVTFADEHLLVARVCRGVLNFVIGVGHAPHCGHPAAHRDAWWSQLRDQLDPHLADGALPFLLLDANAKTGPHDGAVVHCHDDLENANTENFRITLTHLGMCLPSTTTVHRGDHTTWVHPSGEWESRIDYVAIPQSHLHQCTHSCVMHDFDLATQHCDHRAVGVQLQWEAVHQHQVPGPPSHAQVARSSIKHASLEPSLLQHYTCSWEQDIETQVQALNETIHKALRAPQQRSSTRPKKSFITPDLWGLRQAKLAAGKASRQWKQRHNQHLVLYGFQRWARPHATDEIKNDNHSWIRRMKLAAKYIALTKQLRQGLRRAKLMTLHRDLEHLGPGAQSCEVIQLVKQYKGTTNLSRKRTQTLPEVLDEQGQICQDPQRALDRWVQFFCDMEGGQRMSSTELHTMWRQHLADAMQSDSWEAALASVPTLTDLELAMRRVQSGKATGPDGICSETCKYHAAPMAVVTYSQVLKLLIHSQESWRHKGGVLVTAYKGKGPTNACASYRSLLISSHIGKTVHRTIRQSQYQTYEAWLHHTQIGGRRAFPVGAGVHLLRSYMRWKAAEGSSFGIIFVDLQEAFYRVLRPLVLEGGYSDRTLVGIVRRFGLGPSAFQDLQRHLREPPAVQRAGLQDHYRRALTALHENTWFQMRGQEDFTRTEVGTRPGDSFADVIFGYVFSVVLKDLYGQLRDRQLLDHFPAQGVPGLRPQWHIPHQMEEFTGVTWMDDTCLGLSTTQAKDLVPRLGEALSILLDTCRGYGLTPNLRAGKTEVLLSLRGPGSRKLRWQYHGPQQGRQLPVICEEATVQVHLVTDYKHLGGRVNHRGNTTPETRQRLAMAHATFTEHRRLLFANKTIPWPKRRELFDMLILSKLAYGSESWVTEQQASKQALHSGILRLYRRLLRVPHDAHLTDEAVILASGLPEPATLLRRARLRYLCTLYRACSNHMWSILRLDQSWVALVNSDLVWLWHQLCAASDLPDPRQDFPAWERLIIDSPKYWKKLVNRGVRHETLQLQNHEQVRDMHGQVDAFLQAAGFPPARAAQTQTADDQPAPVQHHFGCLTCKVPCRSKGGEGAHMFRCHGKKANERYLIQTSQCAACLREYHTVTKLQAHLRYSGDCRRHLIARRAFGVPPPGFGSSEATSQTRLHDGVLPVRQAQGPHIPAALGQDFDHHDDLFEQMIVDALFDLHNVAEIGPTVRGLVTDKPISWTLFRATVAHLCDQLGQAEADHMGLPYENLSGELRTLCDPASWDFLSGSPGPGRTTPPLTLHDYELHFQALARDVKLCQYFSAAARVPRPVGRERYVLHAFSGRRRPGDIEWFIDGIRAESPQEILLFVISVDIIIHSELGDVSRAQTKELWYRGVRERWIVGFLAGPPCETWSQARKNALEPDVEGRPRRGPRVIRASDAPWGMTQLRVKEIAQLFTSNVLMTFTIELAVLTILFGGCGMVEHPAPPEDEQAPSIWRQPVMHLLCQLPCSSWIHLDQGRLGAASKKPTSLLAIRMPTLAARVQEWALTTKSPSTVSIGLDSQGRFLTAPLKEYPPAFCKAIAQGLCDTLLQLPAHPDCTVPASFKEVCVRMRAGFGQHIGPDFAKP
eukprot:Skav230934  [mRNA]  locus=scaffold2774:74414:79357:- [translate_table: standard]